MPERFYYPDSWQDHLILDGPEAHHLAHVLRCRPGDEVELFNGRGESAQARVSTISKRTVELQLISVHPAEDTSETTLTIAVAAPKGDRLRWMVEKLTELGIDRVIPLITQRTVVEPGTNKLAKLEQSIIAACKQCGRNRLMELQEPCPLGELPQRIDQNATTIWVGDPQGERPTPGSDRFASQLAIVGPEGGLTEEERTLIASWQARPISLSPHILRVETAAVALATFFRVNRVSS